MGEYKYQIIDNSGCKEVDKETYYRLFNQYRTPNHKQRLSDELIITIKSKNKYEVLEFANNIWYAPYQYRIRMSEITQEGEYYTITLVIAEYIPEPSPIFIIPHRR